MGCWESEVLLVPHRGRGPLCLPLGPPAPRCRRGSAGQKRVSFCCQTSSARLGWWGGSGGCPRHGLPVTDRFLPQRSAAFREPRVRDSRGTKVPGLGRGPWRGHGTVRMSESRSQQGKGCPREQTRLQQRSCCSPQGQPRSPPDPPASESRAVWEPQRFSFLLFFYG